jgi:N-acetylglucosamine kinase-like BadF-type ATPase
MGLFLGIEAVGMRHTAAVVADENGEILGGKRVLSEPLGLHTTPRDLFRSRLNQLVKAIIAEVGLSVDAMQECNVCIGLAGINSKYDSEVDLPREFESLGFHFRKLICTGDAEIVLASHSQSLHGSGILCGMGSTAFVSGSTGFVRAGGWGPAIGDEGSGYWMGRAAARAIGDEADLREEPSVLWKEICRWLEERSASSFSEVPEWTEASLRWQQHLDEYREHLNLIAPSATAPLDSRHAICGFAHQLYLESIWRFVASGFVMPLMRAWELGDARAGQIVEQAANDLANQHFLASRICPDTAIDPLILYGGVLTHNSRFRELVVNTVAKFHGRLLPAVGPWTPGTMRPVMGALLYALADSSSSTLRLPTPQIADRVRSSYYASSEDFRIQND